ncbi:bcl-2-like protein 11 [Paralichthys olivaceus]|uniref:bcl-2-like protein 11 n=1 Tax=Paralichthys olivaceus TaxID=8255 RepID=UPI0037528AE1
MHPPTRPPNRSDGSTAVTTTEESGGDLPPVGAAEASEQTSRSNNNSSDTGSVGGGEPVSPARCRSRSSVDSLGVFQKRSIFVFPRRRSSGYFSFDGDSLPLTADKATQTPSLGSQVMKHALQRMAEAHGGGPGTQLHESSRSPSSRRHRNAAEDMQAEAVGQELRRIGDDFNRLLLLRRAGGGHRHIVIHPNQLPHVHQEPAVLLCIGLLLLVIGRLFYLQGSTNLQDHSQV